MQRWAGATSDKTLPHRVKKRSKESSCQRRKSKEQREPDFSIQTVIASLFHASICSELRCYTNYFVLLCAIVLDTLPCYTKNSKNTTMEEPNMSESFIEYGVIPRNRVPMKDYWIWCGSVIQGEDGLYYKFASRWPKYLPFSPGCILGNCACGLRQSLWSFRVPGVCCRTRPAVLDGRCTHNPYILRLR